MSLTGVASLTKELDEFELKKTEARAVTGVLASHPNSTDVHISSLSLTFHGQELLSDTCLELNSGRRYGLIGLNGTGVFPGEQVCAGGTETLSHLLFCRWKLPFGVWASWCSMVKCPLLLCLFR